MFESVTDGLPVVGAEEWYLGGANVVIGLADENGELVGYFGREYHPNRRGPIDQIGGEEPPIGEPQLVIGLALGDDEEIIGWFGGKFFKSVGKAVKTVAKAAVAPVKSGIALTTAPIRAGVAIAKGKPVGKTLARTFVKPVTTDIKAQLAVAKPVLKKAAPIIKSPVTKALVGGLAIAFPPVGLPAAGALAAANIALPYAQRGVAAAQMGLKVAAKITPQAAPKPAAKPVARPVARPVAKPVARPTAVMTRAPAASAAASAAAAAAAKAKAQADIRAKAALALATADKVWSAAKGTMPAQKQAPKAVAAKLQTAAKKTVGATYAAAKKVGDPDTQRGLAVLQVARRLQTIVPAARASIPQIVAPVQNQTYQAIHVDKKGSKSMGAWRAGAPVAGTGNASGTIVLRDGTPIQGNYSKVG